MEPHRTLQTVLADYQQRKANHEQHLSRIQQRIYRIGTIRLLLFVAAIAGAIYFDTKDGPWSFLSLSSASCLSLS